MPPIFFADSSSVSRSPPLIGEELVNMFVERQPPESKSQAPLFGRPGILSFATANGPTRGMWNFNGVAYFVAGTSLWAAPRDGIAVNLGGAILGTGPVSMADNGTQLCIVNGQQGFIYTVAGGIVPITSSAFYPANTVTFMDGYFIFDRIGTNEYFLSALYDGLTYNGLDFASAEGQPGLITATVQNLQLLFLVCDEHIEIWYDAGTADFPFQRYAGGIINYGSVSPYSIVKQDGAIFFLGTDGVFYRLQANVPIRVSTHPMETLIAKEEALQALPAATTQTFTLEGHKLVFLTLWTTLQTIVFDISTGKWHKWRSYTPTGHSLGVWRGAHTLEIYGGVLVGDYASTDIGMLSWSTYMEYTALIIATIISAPQHHDRKKLFISSLETEFQAGVGLTTGQGSNPQVMMDYSRDGGQTWSKQQRWKTLGVLGAFLTRVRWTGLGSGRQYVFRLTISDPVWRVFISAHADIAIGM